MTKRLNVLVSAYACRPGEGSEPGIGWDVVQELAKYHQLWVLTRVNNQAAIEASLSQQSLEGITFIYFDLPVWARWWKQGQRGVQLHYYLWQLFAYFVARQLCQTVVFDLAHHVTYVKYWGPSFLALLPIPYVWGPVGGGESAPLAFWSDFSWRGKGYEIVRNIARWIGEHDPFVRLTAQRSTLARATTQDTANRLHHLGATAVQIYSQVGLSQTQIEELAAYANQSEPPPLRLISIGRLLHWKGFHLGLRAFAQADLPQESEYWIVGDGPERQRLQALAETLSIAHRVKFWGKLSRQETLQRLGKCSVLVHPSLHESGGMVCLEAMASGRPVICLDLGGPSVQVTERTGFKIAPLSPEQAVQDIATALTTLTKSPKLWQQMSQSCIHHVQTNYSWKARCLEIAELYHTLKGGQPSGNHISLTVLEKF